MIRKIIQIDEEKCNGCGLCAHACHEGAIHMDNGKARLIRDDYCDGLGDCLPSCPTGAITFVKREAVPYDEAAVLKQKQNQTQGLAPSSGGCIGSNPRQLQRKEGVPLASMSPDNCPALGNWPVQIKLAPVNATYFDGADLLIAADCSAFAYGNFHRDFIRDKITLIGCPKLDSVDYSHKLTQIIQGNQFSSLTIVRMEVPCCGGIEQAAVTALKNSGKFIPWQVVTISIDGKKLN